MFHFFLADFHPQLPTILIFLIPTNHNIPGRNFSRNGRKIGFLEIYEISHFGASTRMGGPCRPQFSIAAFIYETKTQKKKGKAFSKAFLFLTSIQGLHYIHNN